MGRILTETGALRALRRKGYLNCFAGEDKRAFVVSEDPLSRGGQRRALRCRPRPAAQPPARAREGRQLRRRLPAQDPRPAEGGEVAGPAGAGPRRAVRQCRFTRTHQSGKRLSAGCVSSTLSFAAQTIVCWCSGRIAHLVLHDLGALVDHRLPLLRVELRRDQAGQLVDARVGETGAVRQPDAGCRACAGSPGTRSARHRCSGVQPSR